jgi:uncharacterized protein (TIGR03000 family)
MRWHSFLQTAAVAAATVSLLGTAAPAARGHWGGGHWGGGYWGGGHWGGGWGPGFYRPYYGYGFGLGAFGLGLGLGYGLGYGFGGYYAPYYGGYGGYGGYAPYYGPYGPAVYPPVVAGYGGAAPNPNATGAPGGNQPPPDNAAHLQLMVPDGAEVWFAGTRIAREGRVREFVSPPLAPGRSYTYQIVVRYTDAAGKSVEDKRDIQVRANDWFSIDFTRPPPAGKPAPLPLPSS